MSQRLAVAAVVVLALGGLAAAQEKKPDVRREDETYRQQVLRRAEQEYREFYKRPETVPEYWAAIQYEIGVGRFGLAAHLLHGLVDITKDDAGRKALLDVEEQEGLTAFLRLRVIPGWMDDPNLPAGVRDRFERQARADAEEVISRVTKAVQTFLSGSVRIGKMISLLSGSEDENRYALAQLRRSGATAVPYLVEALKQSPNAQAHQALLDTLVALGDAVVPPLLAALDADDAALRIEVIDVLERRRERGAVPWLWYPSATGPEGARRKATEALTHFLGLGAEKLLPAKLALTCEAERYYGHQVAFPPGPDVPVWQWDHGRLLMKTMTPAQAEGYYALQFARQALAIDAAYEPAQVIFLSTALEEGARGSGMERALGREPPAVTDLVRVVNPRLVMMVLERALRERRLPVILGAVWTLGDLGDPRAARPQGRHAPVLVRALNYPDRRVQLAAADALLRLPGPPAFGASARVVEVLRRALAAPPRPTVLVADPHADRGTDVAHAVEKAGYGAVVVTTGRDVLRRLAEAADVDAVLVEASLPYPELPYLLAQLRADVDAGLLPVLVTVARLPNGAPDEDRERALRRLAEGYPAVWVMSATISPQNLKDSLATRIGEVQGKLLSPEERRANAALALVWLRRMAIGEASGYDVRPAEGAIVDALRIDELAPLAAEAAARLPGRDPQRRLAEVVLNPSRSSPIRAAAALALGRHMEQFGLVLLPDQVRGIEELYQTLATDAKESKLRLAVAPVLGSMHPDPHRTGRRLEQYAPVIPAPPPTPAREPADRERGDPDK